MVVLNVCVLQMCIILCVCRFVEFATTQDVLNAIQEFNNYDVGKERKLLVKVKEDRAKREERIAWINKEQDFLNSLHATGELEEFNVDRDVPDNPLEPRYIPCHLSSPEKPTPPAGESVGPTETLLSSSAGAASLKASPPRAESEEKSNGSSPKDSKDETRMSLPCRTCQTPTTKRCICTTAPYCNRDCQRKDWDVHKKTCSANPKKNGTRVQKQPDSPPVAKVEDTIPMFPGPLKLARNINDEGFYISVGGPDDIEDNDDDDDDDDDAAADARVSMSPSQEKVTNRSLDSSLAASTDKMSGSSVTKLPQCSHTSSVSVSLSPSLFHSSLPAAPPSQEQLHDDVVEHQPSTPPGSPPLPGQSSNTPVRSPSPSQNSTDQQSECRLSTSPDQSFNSPVQSPHPSHNSIRHNLALAVTNTLSEYHQPRTPPESPPIPDQDSNNLVQPPPPLQDSAKDDLDPTVATRKGEKTPERDVKNYLSIQEILAVFDQCPTPLSSNSVSEFPPAEFVGIVTNVFSPTQFHAVIASSHVKEALVKLFNYGSSVTPAYCDLADLNEGSLYGYIDDYGDFYRVELSYRSGVVGMYDIGTRLTVQTARLFNLSEEIKSIPCLYFQMTLRNVFYYPDKKKEGMEFLFKLVKDHPMLVTNHSIRAYKSNKDISFIVTTLTSLDRSTDVSDQVLKNGFASAKVKNEDSNNSGRQSKDSEFRKKLDTSPTKADSSPGKISPPKSPPTKGQEEKGGGSGGGAVASMPWQTSGGASSSPVMKSPPLLRSLEARKPMFIDGSPDKIGNLRNSVSMNQNGNQSSENRPQTPPTQKLKTPDGKSGIKYKLVQMSNKVPFHNPPVGIMIEVRPIVVLNPNIIWAQVMHSNVSNFKLMESDLNKTYSSRKHEPYAPAPGEMCAAKFAQDQKYYRVEVLCVNHSGTVDIQLVDYGHRDTVTMRQIHHLEPIFLSLPKQALQFSLVGIVPAGMANTWSDNAIAFLKEKILNRVVPMRIVMQTPATCMAEVWDPDEPMQLLNAALVELGLAQDASMMGGVTGGGGAMGGGTNASPLRGVSVTAFRQDQPKVQQTSPTIKTQTTSPLKTRPTSPLDLEEQLPSLVTSKPSKVSSHSCDSKQPLGEQVSAGATSLMKPNMLHFNLPMLLKKPEDFKKPNPSDAINSSCSPLLSPRFSLPSSAPHAERSPGTSPSLPKSPNLESEPQKRQSFHAGSPVTNIAPSTQASMWSTPGNASSSNSATVTKASGWSPKQSSTVSSSSNAESTKGGGGWGPKSPSAQQEAILGRQVELSKSSIGRERSPHAQVGRPPPLRNNQKLTVDSIQLEPSGKPVEAIMLYVESPLRFCIQVVKEELCDGYMKMAKELNGVDLIPLTNPSSGDFCLCRFPDDSTIGRVKILRVENDSALVQHIDYGNRKRVLLNAIFKMDQRFVHIPAQAVTCTLNQLLNPSGKGNPWKQEAMDFFLAKVGSPNVLSVECVQVVRSNVHVVNVTTSAQIGGKDLLSLMVEAKLGGSTRKFDRNTNQGSRREEACKGRRSDRSPFSKSSPSSLIGSPLKQNTSSSEGALPWMKSGSPKTGIQSDSPFNQQAMKSPFSESRSKVSPPSSSEGALPGTKSSSPKTAAAVVQSDSPFKKQTTKSPFSESRNKVSPPKDSPGKPMIKSEVNAKPSSSKKASILVSSLEKVPLPSECDTFTLLVTEIHSPNEFYIQTANSAGKNDELFTSLFKYFSENKCPPIAQVLAQGSLVCAKFSQDGVWYRAEVLETSADSCRVRFIDFGNVEMVRLCDMAECPPKFVSFPILASCCQLGGVAPPTGSTMWSEDAIQLLKEACSGVPLQAVIVDSASSPPSLKLTNSQDVDLATELINRGLATVSKPSKLVPAVTEEASTIKTVVGNTYPQVASLSKIPLPSESDSFTLLVTEVCSPDEFYIQSANSAGKIEELCTLLFSHFTSSKSPPLTQPPGVGCLICAKFSQDGAWYRAEVLETSADGCRVRFIDFGNIEMVRLGDMAECPPEFVSFPILASCCRLGGVAPPTGSTTWSEDAIQLLKEACSGVPLQAVIVDHASSRPALKLTNSQDVDLATELINRGLATVSKPSKLVPAVIEGASSTEAVGGNTYPLVASLSKIPLPSESDSFTLLVTEVCSPDEFYIQSANSAGKIEELCTLLFSHFTSSKSPPLTQPPGVGCLICAKFSQDGAWYRAKVLETSADGCRVRFIDFGNVEMVRLCDMAECPPEFVSFPILASCCQLGGVTPPTGSTTWPNEATQLLKEACSGVPLQATIVDSASSPPTLKLTNSQDVDLATELINRGLAAASKPSKVVPAVIEESSTTEVVGGNTCPPVASLSKIPLPSESDSFTLLMTEIRSANEFYVQTANSAGKIDELCTSLFKHFSENKSSPIAQIPTRGSLVCAKFSQDGAWYRAEVLETSADSCRVRFIDFGNVEMVQLCDMAECPPEFVSFPILASCCQLGGVTPPTGSTTWPNEATQLLKEACSGVPLQATIVNHASSPPSLKLTNSEGVDLATELVNRGLAAAPGSSHKSATPEAIRAPSINVCPMVVASLQKVALPPENKPFFMIVTDVYSPVEFYIQTLEDSGAIDKLFELLNKYFSTNKPVSLAQLPAKGSLICGKFSQDGAWYRGEVLETLANSCRIMFIDFGNMENVKLSDMTECPPEFISSSFPILASCCRLSGVAPPTGSTTWSDEATQLLIAMASNCLSEGIVVDKSTCPPSIKLKNDSFADFAAELVTKGLASHCGTSPSANQTPAPQYPKISGMQKAELGSNSDYFPIIVSEVWSPEAFFIQILNQNTQSLLEELRNGLDVHFQTHPPSSLSQPPNQGSLVCAKYSQDGAWYRSEVLESRDDCCKMLFIDYGNIEVAKFEDIVPCPVQFTSYPILATKCGLSGVVPAVVSNDNAWSSRASAKFKQLTCGVCLNAKVVGKGSGGGDTVLVELVDTNGSSDVNISSELINQGLAESTNALSESTAASCKVAFADISIADIPTGVPIKIRLVSVDDPSKFFIHYCERSSISALQEMVMTLQSTYNTSSYKYGGFVPQVGAVCCCQSLQISDKIWYRCQVVSLHVSRKEAMIQSLDFGFMENLPFDKLLYLDPKFVTLPAQAVPCFLSGVKPTSVFGWNSASKAKFSILLKEKMNAVIEAKSSDGKRGISLFTGNGNKSVATALIETGHATADGAVHPSLSGCGGALRITSDEQKVPPIPIPHSPIPTTKVFPVVLTHVESLSEFYLQINTKEKVDEFCELLRVVHDYAQTASGFKSLPPLGTLCIAMYSDGSWYRAQVVKVINEETCSVFFFDFGNIGNVSLLKMKPITEEKLLSCPIQALKCGLYGVSAIDSSQQSEAMNLFSTLVPLETVKNCHLVSKYPLLVDLEYKSGCPTLSVRDELVRSGYIPKPNELGLLSIPTNKLPVNVKPAVLVAEIKDPSNFWLQVIDKAIAHQFQVLTEEIHHYATGGTVQVPVPVLGQLCIANYSQDGVWYRAKVIQVDGLGEGRVKVQFIDYGNEETVDTDQLRPFQHSFKCLPAQAVHCSLVGFKVPAPNLAKKFTSLVENKKLFVIKKDGVPGEICTSVELIDSSGDEDVYIHSKLPRL